PAGKEKVDRRRLGAVREQAARPRLPAHVRRPEAARRRADTMGAAHRRNRRRHASAGAGGRIMIRSFFFWRRRRDARDLELDDEIRAHFAMAVADRMARGESPEDAAAAARREFGNVGHVREVTRESWGAAGLWLERLDQDLRFTARS